MWYQVTGKDARSPDIATTRMVRADSAMIARRRAAEAGMIPQVARAMPRYNSDDYRLYFHTFEEFKDALASPLPKGVEHLDLGFTDPYGPKVIKVLATSPHVGGIREIHFVHQKIGSAELKELAKSVKLKGLTFVGFFWLLGDAVETLANLPFFKSLTSLEAKGDWGPTRGGLDALGHSPHLSNLESITLRPSKDLTADDLESFVESPLMRRLTCLDLGQNRKLGDKGVAALVASKNVAGLTSLTLDEANIKAKGIEALRSSPHLASIEELKLQGNHLGVEGAIVLSKTKSLPKLSHLMIGYNKIQDKGLVALADSPILDHVVSLGLAYNHIEDNGIRALIKSKHLATLQDLDLSSNNKLGSKGLRLLKSSSLARQLEHIELYGIEVDEEDDENEQDQWWEVQGSSSQSGAANFKNLEPWLMRHRRWAWKPIVKKGNGPLLASKFAGTPWLRSGESWPACGNCHGPMHFFVQINLDKLPKSKEVAFGKGMLQFFHCLEEKCLYGKFCQDPYSPCLLVRIVDFDKKGAEPALPEYQGIPAFPAKKITGWKKVADSPSPQELPELGLTYEDGRIECKEIEFVADGVEHDDFDQLSRCVKGDKLSGWADWVQIHTSYPKCRVCKARMDTILFSIGSDDNIPFMFGDGGHGPIVQCPVHKDVLAFTWDSG